VLLVVLHAEEAQLAHAGPYGLGNLPRCLPLLDVRLDLLLHDGPTRLPNHLVVLVENLHDRFVRAPASPAQLSLFRGEGLGGGRRGPLPHNISWCSSKIFTRPVYAPSPQRALTASRWRAPRPPTPPPQHNISWCSSKIFTRPVYAPSPQRALTASRSTAPSVPRG